MTQDFTQDFTLRRGGAIGTLGVPFGQVAQLVERSPEKAGVGGSIPSLATTFQSTYKHLGSTGRASFSTARS